MKLPYGANKIATLQALQKKLINRIKINREENLAICWNIREYSNTLNKIKVKILNCGQSAGKISFFEKKNPQRTYARTKIKFSKICSELYSDIKKL